MTVKFEQLDSKKKKKFQDAIRSLAIGTPEGKEKARIIVEVTGGAPSKRIQYRVEMNGNGKGKLLFMDQLEKIKLKEYTSDLKLPVMKEIFETIDVSRILEEPQNEYQFLPDSLVGTITIEVDDTRKILHFPIDEEEENLTKGFHPVPMQFAKNANLSLDQKKIAPSYLDILDVTNKLARHIQESNTR